MQNESEPIGTHTDEAIRQIELQTQWAQLCPPGTRVVSQENETVRATVSKTAWLKNDKAMVELLGIGPVPCDAWRPLLPKEKK